MTFLLFAQERMLNQHSLAPVAKRLKGLSKTRRLLEGQSGNTIFSEKDLQDEKLSQCSAASDLAGVI